MSNTQEKCLHDRLVTEDCPTCEANKHLWQSGWELGAASRDADVNLLRDAIAHLLDDMGDEGHCVCEAAKQQALAALTITEPK